MEARTGSRPSDQELLRLALAPPRGEEGRRAASELLERYQGRVYTWCLRYVREHERALDMAQEVLLNAYRKLASFHGRSGFGSWIFVITRNRCLSELRRPGLLVEEGIQPDDRAVNQRPPDRLLEDRLAEEEVLGLITACLDPLEQEALWLRCFERVPVQAITRILGIEETSGARGVLQRARRKLRSALKDRRGREGCER